jgi:hypothetical protein
VAGRGGAEGGQTPAGLWRGGTEVGAEVHWAPPPLRLCRAGGGLRGSRGSGRAADVAC